MAGRIRHIVVVDVGKTNVKLVLHDLQTRADLSVRSAPNRMVAEGPYPHADAAAIFGFILEALADLASAHRVDAISISAHGACAALVDAAGELVLPILDYEHPLGEVPAYEGVRPPFEETLSPPMANGLNVGRQLFWLRQTFPDRFTAATHILFHPQYWAFRLTGARLSEVTSLGCHTDLWAPRAGRFSSLVSAMGWDGLFPPVRSAFETAGRLRADLCERVGLAGRSVPVTCGIHDSNASLLPHLLARPTPFTLLSTGTWVVGFALGGSGETLDPARNTLAHVDAFGQPVPAASFMGGREFDLLTQGRAEAPDEEVLQAVVARQVMAMPPIVAGSGPFPRGAGGWRDARPPSGGSERTAAASLYLALTAIESLSLIGARGPIVVEGPLAKNAILVRALAQVTGEEVVASEHGTGTSAGAALLALGRPDRAASRAVRAPRPAPPPIAGLETYAAAWRAGLRPATGEAA